MFKRPTLALSIVLIAVLLVLTACGGGAAKPAASQPAAAPVGNADNGKKLFNEPVIASAGAPGCATCHSLEKDKVIVGPSLAGIATDAAGAAEEKEYKGTAKTADQWLRESITNPDVDVPDGFKPNIMPKTFTKLSTQELDDLVAYLMTLK